MTEIPPQGRRPEAIPEALFYPRTDADKSPDGRLPMRRLANVMIYNEKGQLVGLEYIEREGPFTATGNSDTVVKELKGKLVLLEQISEYDLEFPYGKDVLVWLKTEAAYYAIDSLHPTYRQKRGELFLGATVCGHVMNAFINAKDRWSFARVICKAVKLSGMAPGDFMQQLVVWRSFLLSQLAQQRIPNLATAVFYKTLNSQREWTGDNFRRLRTQIEQKVGTQARARILSSSDSDQDSDKGTGNDDDSEGLVMAEIIVNGGSTTDSVLGKSSRAITPVIVLGASDSSGCASKRSGSMGPDTTVTRKRKRPSAEGDFGLDSVYAMDPVSFTAELPTRLALSYQCPFCGVVLYRNQESVDILQITIDHFHLHQQTRALALPLKKRIVDGWPSLVARPSQMLPLKFDFEPAQGSTDALPLSVCDADTTRTGPAGPPTASGRRKAKVVRPPSQVMISPGVFLTFAAVQPGTSTKHDIASPIPSRGKDGEIIDSASNSGRADKSSVPPVID